jgi:hypothetical protein
MRVFRTEAEPPIVGIDRFVQTGGTTVARYFAVQRILPVIFTGSFAILLGSILYCLIGAYGVILVAGVFLGIGLVGEWMIHRLRHAAEAGSQTVLLGKPELVGRVPDGLV